MNLGHSDLLLWLAITSSGKIWIIKSSPKASNGQRFPCPALLSPWFSWGEAGQRLDGWPGWMAQRGGRTDIQTNGRKISPFYRTSSPIRAAAQKVFLLGSIKICLWQSSLIGNEFQNYINRLQKSQKLKSLLFHSFLQGWASGGWGAVGVRVMAQNLQNLQNLHL